MSKVISRFVILTIGVIVLSSSVGLAQTSPAPTLNNLPDGCRVEPDSPDGLSESILICTPEHWNGHLVVYAHGYVVPQAPLQLPLEELFVDGQFLPATIMAQGFAFATTSYSANGYAIEQAVSDINNLVARFEEEVATDTVDKVLAVGGSEGALVVLKLMEQHWKRYDGGLTLCGPLGGGTKQIKYLGDFRAVFDYFFPTVFDFGVVDVPSEEHTKWESTYVGLITDAILRHPLKTYQLFNVTGAARVPLVPSTSVATALGVLQYSVFGTNDLQDRAEGNPYDNTRTWYRGSFFDWALNRGIERVPADVGAPDYLLKYYEPTGRLHRKVVSLHNTLDPVVPYRHETAYYKKVVRAGCSHKFLSFPVPGYGHCSFTAEQVLGAFLLLFYIS